VLLVSTADTHSQGDDMASKKTNPKKATAKKPAPTKKTAAPKSKEKSAGKATPAQKPDRPSKKAGHKSQTAVKSQAVANPTSTNGGASKVTVSSGVFAPTAIPSNTSFSAATGSVPPESVRKQFADSLASNAPVRKNFKKKSRIRRLFGLFKRSK